MADNVCDICGASDAVVQLTTIVDNEISTSHLCEKCAGEKGLETAAGPSASFPLTDFLAQMGKDTTEQAEEVDVVCNFCGLTFGDFRDSGRLGCPHCWETYEPYLRRLLRRIHGGTQHVGKIYLPPDPTASDVEKRLQGLRRKLHRAVESEDFERAAELRDQIRSMELA